MDVKKPRWARLGSAPVFRAAKPVPAVGASGVDATPTPRGSGLLRVLLHVRGWRTGWPQWTSGSGCGYAVSAFGGVTGYASSAGFGVVFTGATMQGREKLQCRQQFRQILADVLDVSRHVRQRGRKV